MISSITARVKDLYADGNDLEKIYRLLVAEGANHDIVIASLRVIGDENLDDLKPPRNFSDVVNTVYATLCSQKPKEIVQTLTSKTIFGQIMPKQHSTDLNLEENISYAQKKQSEIVFKELLITIRPYLQNMMVHMSMLSHEDSKITAVSDLDKKISDRYIEWFGIWLPETQKAYNSIMSGNMEELILPEIEVISEEMGREQTYCPMYKTEINFKNVCRSCPFFVQKTEEEGVSNRCGFNK